MDPVAVDEQSFKPHTWTDLKHIIENNDLAALRRDPSDLIKYRNWSDEIKRSYDSINQYLCDEKLHWTPLASTTPLARPLFAIKNPILFENLQDFQILRNDWPYGLTEEITHLVVWLKNKIPIDNVSGDLTHESRRDIQKFVRRAFIDRLDRGDAVECVLWFKNWSGLQSVRGIDHIHVLVRNVPETLLREWIN